FVSLTGKRAQGAGPHARNVRNSAKGTSFDWSLAGTGKNVEVNLGLIGRHQADNAVTAIAAAEAWRGVDVSGIERDPALPAMLEALGQVRWPGRLEKVASDPDLWIDVGHTPHALDLVTEAFLDIAPRARTLVVFGVSASKEVQKIAAIVAGRFDHFILTRAHKSGADVASFAGAFAGKDVTIAADTAEAARLAKARAQEEGLAVLALGGLFLAAETQYAWQGGDPKTLDFF
ncbi:MAG TPA: cyanophycin synthetase, partial [Hyphomonadaceae bacterium]|nr:cyanophycin synthetase [Hyphomonadaceae bacterium]